MTENHRFLLSLCAALPLVVACSADYLTASGDPARAQSADRAARDENVAICHTAESGGHIIHVAGPAMGAHLAHGDHVARFIVDARLDPDASHFSRISDAIAAVRAIRVSRDERDEATCRITIAVTPGIYRGTLTESSDPGLERLPLMIDVPDVSLEGSFHMQVDGSGRATGSSATGEGSVLVPVVPLATAGQYSQPLVFVNGNPSGFNGNGVVIEGFDFRSGRNGASTAAGAGVVALRVVDIMVRGNRFEAGFSESIDLRASTGRIDLNHLGGIGAGTGGTCDVCLAGPGTYSARGNRLLAGGLPGLVVAPVVQLPVPPGVAPYVLPASANVIAELVNNEVRDHLRKPVGVGIRIQAVGVNAPNVAGTAHVDVRDNLLANNTFGMMLDGGFPLVNTLRRGDISVTMAGNRIEDSCQADLLVSFSRHTTGLGLAAGPYLSGSGFELALGGDVAWEQAWFSHRAGFGNSLTVDGVPIDPGQRTAYDPSRTCDS